MSWDTLVRLISPPRFGELVDSCGERTSRGDTKSQQACYSLAIMTSHVISKAVRVKLYFWPPTALNLQFLSTRSRS